VERAGSTTKRWPAKVIVLAIFSITGLIIYFSVLYPDGRSSVEPTSTGVPEFSSAQKPNSSRVADKTASAIYKTTAEQLREDYDANETAENQRIGSSMVEVSGNVASIDKDIMDHAVVNLRTSKESTSVGLRLVDSEKPSAATLTIGQPVVARCEKMQHILDTAVGSDCVVVK
jgi:hypothetical protein